MNLIQRILEKNPSLASLDLASLRDRQFTLDTPDTYNIASSDAAASMIARVMTGLDSRCGASADLLRTLLGNITSEATAVGYLAQFQGYDWLLAQDITFTPEIRHLHTLRGRPVDLDGRIDKLGKPVFFDIKSFGFEPYFRYTFSRRLEEKLPGFTFTVDGPGNHGPEDIQIEAFGKLNQHLAALEIGDRIEIPALDWTVTKRKKGPGVRSSKREYNLNAFIQENREVPLQFASQFTTDAPYILMFVLPDGTGSSPLHINVFGFAEQVMQGIAEYLFGPARSDGAPASVHDNKMPSGVTVAEAIARISAIALYSPQAQLALLHINGQAAAPLSKEDAIAITSDWNVVIHQ